MNTTIINDHTSFEDMLKDLKLDYIVIENDRIIEEHVSGIFSARMTHYFLQQWGGRISANTIIRADHFTGYMVMAGTNNQLTYVIGPYLNYTFTNPDQTDYKDMMHIRYKEQSAFREYLLSLNRWAFYDILSLYRELFQALNDYSISSSSIHVLNLNNLNQQYANDTYNSLSMNESISRPYADEAYTSETKICNYIRQGDVDGLRQYLTYTPVHMYSGICDDTLTNHRNMGISAVSLASHYAILGGLGIEQAFRVMDLYIYMLGEENDVNRLLSLISSALLEFARSVHAGTVNQDVPPVIRSAISYINLHITENINVQLIAGFLNINPSYLSRLFKKYMGITMSSYITERKIAKAKELLQITNHSLSTISSELSFSSQPHFQKVFKEETGMTPSAYRMHLKSHPGNPFPYW